MIEKLDRQKEGLRAPARIMAETYRKGKTLGGVEEPLVNTLAKQYIAIIPIVV